MKTTLDLLNAVVAMGFNKEYALEEIDASLDDEFGAENRIRKYFDEKSGIEIEEDIPLNEEYLSDELYNDMLDGFKILKDEREREAKEAC